VELVEIVLHALKNSSSQ